MVIVWNPIARRHLPIVLPLPPARRRGKSVALESDPSGTARHHAPCIRPRRSRRVRVSRSDPKTETPARAAETTKRPLTFSLSRFCDFVLRRDLRIKKLRIDRRIFPFVAEVVPQRGAVGESQFCRCECFT